MMVQKAASRGMETKKRKEKRNGKVGAFSFSPSSAAAATVALPRKRYMGVRRSPSGRWVAEIKGTAQRIRLWLGTFDTAEEAARAYDEAACLLRGADTRTNFWPRSSGLCAKPGTTSSILPAKVFNHLLRHIEALRAADSQTPSPPPPPPSMQQQQLELEPPSDVSFSSATQSGMSYCNIRHQGKAKEEEEMACFNTQFEMETYEYWLMLSSAAKNV